MLPPKSKKGYREIDIDAGLAWMLRSYLDGRTSGLAFQSWSGTPLRGGNMIKRQLNPILIKLGIPPGGKLEMTDRYGHTDQELEDRREHAARVGTKLIH